jgi:hypothetical protein
MSYFPDYRHETDKLNDVDKAFINGYRKAMEDAMCFFDNENYNDALSIEKEISAKIQARLEGWMEGEETVTVMALFNEADYLPDDIELKDANKPMFNR